MPQTEHRNIPRTDDIFRVVRAVEIDQFLNLEWDVDGLLHERHCREVQLGVKTLRHYPSGEGSHCASSIILSRSLFQGLSVESSPLKSQHAKQSNTRYD